MTITKFISLLILLNLSTCTSCEDPEWARTLPPETQTGANTLGCYVNENLFVAQYGFGMQNGTPIYADYISQIGLLEISTSEFSDRYVRLEILHPKENAINTSFRVFAAFNGEPYAGLNWFYNFDNDGIFSYIGGNQDIGEIYITRFDSINKIVSGNFHCKMGKSENFNNVDINTYKLYPIANISQGRFDLTYIDY